MPTITIRKTYSVPGYTSRQAVIERSEDGVLVRGGPDAPITLNPAKPVTDFAEGDPNVATCNLTAGHGLTTGVCDVYWTESGVAKVRYGVTATINTNAVALADGATAGGDDYPSTIADGLCVICMQKQIAAPIDGDEVALFWAALIYANLAATGRGHVDFQEADGTQVGEIDVAGIVQGVAIVDYDITGGASNPLTGEPIALAMVTHNDTAYTPTFELVVLEDATV
jgi:hypothetical protein